MNNQSNSKVNWLHSGVAVLFGVAATFLFFALNNRVTPAPIIINPAPTQSILPTEAPKPLQVFINGAVNREGVFELDAGSRVQALIEAAGGFSADAYTDNINLAAELSDGMQLFVSTQEQADSIQSQLLANPIQQSDPIIRSSGSSGVDVSGRVNINNATIAELETLPGVGVSTAEKIIAYREENGLFTTIEDILNVSGIGEGKFDDMQEYITVGND